MTSCGARSNPLSKVDQAQLARQIYQKKSEELEFCAQKWSDKAKAEKDDLKDCETQANQLATFLRVNGYGDVTAADVQSSAVWAEFNELIKADRANSYDPKKAADAFKLVPARK
jgi:hypothetical protein